MKNIITRIVLLLAFLACLGVFSFGQDETVEIKKKTYVECQDAFLRVPVLERLITNKNEEIEKHKTTISKLNEKLANAEKEKQQLENKIAKLELLQNTPCSSAIQSAVKVVKEFPKLDTSNLSKEDAKAVRGVYKESQKFLRYIGRRAVKKSCTVEEANKFITFLKEQGKNLPTSLTQAFFLRLLL